MGARIRGQCGWAKRDLQAFAPVRNRLHAFSCFPDDVPNVHDTPQERTKTMKTSIGALFAAFFAIAIVATAQESSAPANAAPSPPESRFDTTPHHPDEISRLLEEW